MINDRANLIRYAFRSNQIVTIEKIVILHLDERYYKMLTD